MVRRFWVGTASGAYVGRGETYLDPKDVNDESPARIEFLPKILADAPADGLNNLSTCYCLAGWFRCFANRAAMGVHAGRKPGGRPEGPPHKSGVRRNDRARLQTLSGGGFVMILSQEQI